MSHINPNKDILWDYPKISPYAYCYWCIGHTCSPGHIRTSTYTYVHTYWCVCAQTLSRQAYFIALSFPCTCKCSLTQNATLKTMSPHLTRSIRALHTPSHSNTLWRAIAARAETTSLPVPQPPKRSLARTHAHAESLCQSLYAVLLAVFLMTLVQCAPPATIFRGSQGTYGGWGNVPGARSRSDRWRRLLRSQEDAAAAPDLRKYARFPYTLRISLL